MCHGCWFLAILKIDACGNYSTVGHKLRVGHVPYTKKCCMNKKMVDHFERRKLKKHTFENNET